MNIHEICNGVYYVGVNDRTTHRFEGLWPLPAGVSYNSYIVKGERVALIDTVHVAQSSKFLNRIGEIIGDAAIDYLVINHMEPDHSGSIEAIKAKYPALKIVGNGKTAAMLKGFYGIGSEDVLTVADGDVIDLGGGKTLKFVFTPMVHWPETMMTYMEQDGVLFSGDAFGCFGALNGGVVDSQMDTTLYYPEMYRYYSNIVAKYGQFVQKAIAKFDGVSIRYVCSTHGPVWHDEIARVVDTYSRMARFEGEPGVVVAYASMYGNTEELAETVHEQAVPQITVVGTKQKPVSISSLKNSGKAISELQPPASLQIVNGAPTQYSKIITGKAAAYTDHPGAKTASGRTVKAGYIAVNPKQIPYGTELWIVSTDGIVYGYAIAADTGGFVKKGKFTVDLFMNSESECVQWGARDVVIYVL